MKETLKDQSNDKCCLIIVISCSASCQVIRYCEQHEVLQLLASILWFHAVEMLCWQDRKPEAEQLWNFSWPGQAQVPHSSHHVMAQLTLPREFHSLLIDECERRHHSVDYNVELIRLFGLDCGFPYVQRNVHRMCSKTTRQHLLALLLRSLNC